MVSTVRPKAKATPRNPIPRFGNAASSTAAPHPPNTNQKVPKNSAAARFPSVIVNLAVDSLRSLPCEYFWPAQERADHTTLDLKLSSITKYDGIISSSSSGRDRSAVLIDELNSASPTIPPLSSSESCPPLLEVSLLTSE